MTHPTGGGGDCRPDYYDPKGPYEPWKVIRAWGLDNDFALATAISYIARAGKKTADPEEDIVKAVTYLKQKLAWLAEDRGKPAGADPGPDPGPDCRVYEPLSDVVNWANGHRVTFYTWRRESAFGDTGDPSVVPDVLFRLMARRAHRRVDCPAIRYATKDRAELALADAVAVYRKNRRRAASE